MQTVVEESTFLKLQTEENLCTFWSRENSSENKPVPSPQSDPKHSLGLAWSLQPRHCLELRLGGHIWRCLGGLRASFKSVSCTESPGDQWPQNSSMSKPSHESTSAPNTKFVAFGEYKHRLFFQTDLLQKWSLIRGSQGNFEFQKCRVLAAPFQLLFKGWQEVVKTMLAWNYLLKIP